MPRIARAVAVGFPHHITQRGNYRQRVFEGDDDYRQYLEWLQFYGKKYSLKIWAYCLMGNHVHFIVVPMAVDSMSRTFNTLHMRYSQYFNRRHEDKGHLWQGRYYSCALDEPHLYAGIRYVENNPVKARIVKRAEQYTWSSARAHVKRIADLVLAGDCYLVESIDDWSTYLREKEDAVLIGDIRNSTKTGRPCGDDSFIEKIEKRLGRKLAAFSRGRPQKMQ